MTNNDIKHVEATQLNDYLDTLSYWERVEFVSEVMAKVNISRRTFFNWKYMSCRIPARAKEAIESVAGKLIFIPASNEA